MAKYGALNLRGQPPHMGHQAIVNEMVLDGLTPILILGSSNNNRDLDKNPLTYDERVDLWELLYGNIEMIYIESWDQSNETWYEEIHKGISTITNIKNVVMYYHDKEVDRTTFEYWGVTYKDTFYTDIFRDNGWKMKQVAFANRSDIKIDANARDIRHNLEAFKHLLDGRIYNRLKELGWQ